MPPITPALMRAIERVLLAGHGQRRWLKPEHPPFGAFLSDALKHYGNPGPAFDLWMICAAIHDLEAAWSAVEKAEMEETRRLAIQQALTEEAATNAGGTVSET